MSGSHKTHGHRGSSKWKVASVAVVIVALQAAAALYFSPPSVVTAQQPISTFGFARSSLEVAEPAQALLEQGRLRRYDPTSSAGAFHGATVERSSLLWQLWTAGLIALGVPKWTAFNLFIWFAHMLPVFALFGAARLFGLGTWAALFASALGAALWSFDGFAHWCWFDGQVGLAVSMLFAAVWWGAFLRYLKSARPVFGVATSALAVLAAAAHPAAALAFAAIVASLLVARRKDLPRGALTTSAIALGCAAAVALIDVVFLGALAKGGALGEPSGSGGTLGTLVADIFGLNAGRDIVGGASVRVGFRLLSLSAAVFILIEQRKSRTLRWHALMVGVGVASAFAYLGGYVPGVGRSVSYGQILLALNISAVGAAWLAQEFAEKRLWSKLPRFGAVLLAVAFFAALPRLGRDVVYFIPSLFPGPEELPEEKPHIADMVGFGSIGYPRHRHFRHLPVSEDWRKIAASLENWSHDQGRVLVESAPLAAYLDAVTQVEVIGAGVGDTAVSKSANIFVAFSGSDPDKKTLEEYLEKYAVGWVIVSSNPDPGDRSYRERLVDAKELLVPARLRPAQYRVLRTKKTTSYFVRGAGRVAVEEGIVRVSETDPDEELVIKYHHFDELTCRPGCSMEPFRVGSKGMGPGRPFIRVLAPHPASFEIGAR